MAKRSHQFIGYNNLTLPKLMLTHLRAIYGDVAIVISKLKNL